MPYLLVTVMYRKADSRVSKDYAESHGDICQCHISSKKQKKSIHMHIGGATLIAQREGNVSPLMQENIKEEEMGKEHDVNKEIKLSGERRKKWGGCI